MMQQRLTAPDMELLNTKVSRELASDTQSRFLLQFSAPGEYSAPLLQALDELCEHYGERLELRFFGHYQQAAFDARVLLALPHVRALTLDCLNAATAVETVAELGQLTSLQLGIEKLNLNPLMALPNLWGLHSLRLSQETGPKVDLSTLALMQALHTLALGVHCQGLEALQAHPVLSTLYVPGHARLDFLQTLPNLHRLFISFGSREAMPQSARSEPVSEFAEFEDRGSATFAANEPWRSATPEGFDAG